MKKQILGSMMGPVVLLVATVWTSGNAVFARETILDFGPPGPAGAAALATPAERPTGQPTRLVSKANRRAGFESSATWCRAMTVQLDQKEYTVLELPGGSRNGEFGDPQLPGYAQFIKVPEGARVRLVVDKVKWVELPGRYNLAPRQPPPPDKAGAPPPPFARNKAAYERNRFLPAQPVYVAGQMRIRGQDLVHVVYAPVAYNPAKGRLKAARQVTWHLEFDLAKKTAAASRPDARGQREFAPLLQGMLDARANAAGTLPEGVDLATGSGADYLIITHDNFYTNILPLATWKHAKGYQTRVVRLSEISATPTSTNITAYIQNANNTWNPSPTRAVGG
jgi:hypothetical protein